MLRKYGIVLLIITILLTGTLGLMACEGETTTPEADEYRILVYKDGAEVGSLNLDMLHSLPVGETEEGPTLTSALALLGIEDFTSVTVEGLSQRRVASAELTLQRSEVNEAVILAFNQQGKTKLTGKEIPRDYWIIDVSALRVQ